MLRARAGRAPPWQSGRVNETPPNLPAQIAGGITRGVAAGVGTATAVSSHDEFVQLLGALVTAASIGWSIYEKLSAEKARNAPRDISQDRE